MPKNPAAISLGRLGGKARAARMSSLERAVGASKASSAYWAKLSPQQRSAVMKKRAANRERKAKETHQ